MDVILFPKILEGSNRNLEEVFTMKEVKEVVWECDGNKCPGPDGYNFSFLHRCWNTLAGDIYAFVSEFHSKENLHKVVTSSFIALIPKVENPQVLGDCRPISLVESLSKIIAKLLANRLKKVVGELISSSQMTFMSSR
ncbi:unnamed protein product [Vicia faba]|uniref:Cysteine-rich receptor-like protein kinase n=1 Tax=Vicia faba TaxID=3906 RepID=A0AAV1AHN8_VICFA|nr:unnamed protein product [Vicia faba]